MCDAGRSRYERHFSYEILLPEFEKEFVLKFGNANYGIAVFPKKNQNSFWSNEQVGMVVCGVVHISL